MIIFIFGDDSKTFFHTPIGNVLDYMLFGHQSGGYGETSTGYRIDYGTSFTSKTSTVVNE